MLLYLERDSSTARGHARYSALIHQVQRLQGAGAEYKPQPDTQRDRDTSLHRQEVQWSTCTTTARLQDALLFENLAQTGSAWKQNGGFAACGSGLLSRIRTTLTTKRENPSTRIKKNKKIIHFHYDKKWKQEVPALILIFPLEVTSHSIHPQTSRSELKAETTFTLLERWHSPTTKSFPRARLLPLNGHKMARGIS